MENNKSWSSFLTVCLACVLTAQADIKAEAQVGQLFVHELERSVYQHDFPPYLRHYGIVYDDSMVFKCNLQHHPDLPRWLRYTQRSPRHNGFLYGAPERTGSAVIEITVINQRTYDTLRNRMVIRVSEPAKMMPYQVDFFLPNRDVEEVLPPGEQEVLKQYAAALWKPHKPDMINISSALDRGGRVPLPLPAHKEGVYVKLGSDRAFPECLKEIQTSRHQELCTLGEDPAPCSVWLSSHNRIDWCHTSLADLSTEAPPSPAPTWGSGILDDGGFYDPPESPEGRDYFLDYIGTVIVPFVLAIVLCLVLAYVMCCRREGVERRNAKTPEIQLYHHHTIHDNTEELRSLAGSRAAARPLSTLPMFNARSGESMPPFRSDSAHIPLILAQQDPNTDTLPR
uniref:Sarcoglycan, alpha n=1 Tax=Lepisosteus oculatus TaxID=7918 RepID=W5N604_LEPOC|nr:PREDICTED: alpha-sarcoglycan [Lepisosteus oculatus]